MPEPHKFILSCTPPTEGEYILSVTVGCREVQYSPFRFWAHQEINHHSSELQSGIQLNDTSAVIANSSVGTAHSFVPVGLAVSSNGNLYVSCMDSCIKVFNEDGSFKQKFGSQGNACGQFQNPQKLTIYDDVLYVADSGNNRIQKFSLHGEYMGEFGGRAQDHHQALLSNPKGITHNGKGHIFVADDKALHMFKTDGTHLKQLECQSNRVCVDNEDNINAYNYYGDGSSSLISRYSLDGQSLGSFNVPVTDIRGIAFNIAGDCFIVGKYQQNHRNQRNYSYSSNNNFSVVLHTNDYCTPVKDNCFLNPADLTVDRKGFIYVVNADGYGNSYVSKF